LVVTFNNFVVSNVEFIDCLVYYVFYRPLKTCEFLMLEFYKK
jgi:hypothetical protein